jgi:hypothetical protein
MLVATSRSQVSLLCEPALRRLAVRLEQVDSGLAVDVSEEALASGLVLKGGNGRIIEQKWWTRPEQGPQVD